MREKLIEQLTYLLECELDGDCSVMAKEWADHLLANDVVPVVRCKDCKHWDTEQCSDDQGWCQKVVGYRSGKWHCAAGERK